MDRSWSRTLGDRSPVARDTGGSGAFREGRSEGRILGSIAAMVLFAMTGVAGFAAVPSRPNILILLTDDQRWDAMGCAGNRIVQTPEMDRLAAEGPVRQRLRDQLHLRREPGVDLHGPVRAVAPLQLQHRLPASGTTGAELSHALA